MSNKITINKLCSLLNDMLELKKENVNDITSQEVLDRLSEWDVKGKLDFKLQSQLLTLVIMFLLDNS